MRGPIDYIIVGFDGLKFDGSVLRALGDAVESDVIDLVALAVVAKDAEGTVTKLNIADLGDDYIVDFSQTHNLDNELVDQEDIDEVADLLAEDSAAALLVVEHLWAKPLKKAIFDAGGFLIADGRIHPDATAELNEQGE